MNRGTRAWLRAVGIYSCGAACVVVWLLQLGGVVSTQVMGGIQVVLLLVLVFVFHPKRDDA